MNCQKCRTPLKLDNSLQDLNPAALDLLVGSTGHSVDQDTTTSRLSYPQEHKNLYNEVSQHVTSPVFKRVVPAARPAFGTQAAMAASTKAGLKENPAMSFVLLTDSQVVSPQHTTNGQEDVHPKRGSKETNTISQDAAIGSKQTLSHQVESTTRLFEILSSRSDVDHPICAECTELLLSQISSRLSASTKERDAYISFLKNLNNTTPTPSEVSKAQALLTATRAAEAQAFSELVALEKEKAALDGEVAALEVEALTLDDEEQAFWRARNAFALTLSSFQNDRDALSAAYDHDAKQLERLQRTNVYNDTFCIGHDGFFGTINGLRLGRLPPPQNVDWSEINAAWGSAALLLATVADKLGFQFRGYKIRPMGSTSKIEKLEISPSASEQSNTGSKSTSSDPTLTRRQQPKVTSLDLFSSGDLPLGRMILHRRLDTGMVAFLECLRQLGELVETSSANAASPHPGPPSPASPKSSNGAQRVSSASGIGGLKLPYIVRKDRIGDESIKLGVSSDEAWTRACKYTLTCCKFLLAHASNVAGDERRATG